MKEKTPVLISAGNVLLKPITKNAPFIIVYFLLNNILVVIQNVHGKIADPSSFADFSFFSLIVPLFIYFLQAYIMAAIITATGKRWVKGLFYFIIFSLATVRIFLDKEFGFNIGPLLLTILAETNGREASEFISTYIFSMPTLAVIGRIAADAVAAVALEWAFPKYITSRINIGQKPKAVLSTVLAVVLLIGCYSVVLFNNSVTEFIRTGTDDDDGYASRVRDPMSKIYSSFRFIIATRGEMSHEVQVTASMRDDVKTVFSDDSLNVVLVIGESYIKSHAAIYGYKLPTTPNMSAEQAHGNLFAFTNVCTPFSHTTEVLRNLLCTNSIGNGERWSDTPFVPAIFHRAGFNVIMWDNQKTDDIDAEWTFTLNSLLYDKKLSSLSYDKTNAAGWQYDGQMIDAYKKDVKAYGARNFIIFHLMGQHNQWSDRYPNTKENMIFTGKDVPGHAPWLNDDKRQNIAEYDNATLYNDKILGEIFNIFRHKGNTVIVYVPDHGEEVYDWRDSQGRKNDPMCANLLKYQYDVPFVVWCTDNYKTAHPDIIRNIQGALQRAFETDNTCQLLFDLAGLKTKYYHADRDLISPNYRKQRRIVNNDVDYDAVRWQ